MSGEVEKSTQDSGEHPIGRNIRFPYQSLRRMADFLRKRRGRPVKAKDAEDALVNLTQYFKWLTEHREELKDDAS